nr:MAG TPA: hypothetical protein [Caudoviricetes sp.]
MCALLSSMILCFWYLFDNFYRFLGLFSFFCKLFAYILPVRRIRYRSVGENFVCVKPFYSCLRCKTLNIGDRLILEFIHIRGVVVGVTVHFYYAVMPRQKPELLFRISGHA